MLVSDVRGYDKVLAHLMFGMTVLDGQPADALNALIGFGPI